MLQRQKYSLRALQITSLRGPTRTGLGSYYVMCGGYEVETADSWSRGQWCWRRRGHAPLSSL
jgi:hypothetical protein